jgi:hypothetical protein
VLFYRGILLKRGVGFWKKMPIKRGCVGNFLLRKYFSEEKSPELSQVGRPSTAHPCRGWEGGQVESTEYKNRDHKYFNFHSFRCYTPYKNNTNITNFLHFLR